MSETMVESVQASDRVSNVHEGKRRDWGWTSVSVGAGLGGIVAGAISPTIPGVIAGVVLGSVSLATAEKTVTRFRNRG